MTPTEFPQQTVVLKRPPNMTDEECRSLAIHQTARGECISCWTGTWRDRLRFLLTGRVWLWVVSGRTQPPVYVGTESPWKGVNEPD